MKSWLALRIAGATHDWDALLLQLRMEYMHRQNSVMAYPHSVVVRARPLVSPVEPAHPPAAVAAVELPMLPEKMSIQQRQHGSGVTAVGRSRHAHHARHARHARHAHYARRRSWVLIS